MKKIISLTLCTAILLISALIPAGAVEEKPYFQVVSDKIYVPANKVLMSAYNLENETNYEYYVLFEDVNNEDNAKKDYI